MNYLYVIKAKNFGALEAKIAEHNHEIRVERSYGLYVNLALRDSSLCQSYYKDRLA